MPRSKTIIESAEVITQQLGVLAPSLIPLVTSNPAWGTLFTLFFSVYMGLATYKQQRLNEVAEFIQKNPKQFRKEIIASDEFKDGFLVFLVDYLKSRIRSKREILKNIFLGFTTSEDKETFELERMNSCLDRMSFNALEFLVLFQKEIRSKIESNLLQRDQDALRDFTDRSAEWWHEMALLQESIWDPYIIEWLDEHYSPQKPSVKIEYGMDIEDSEWPADKLARATSREKEERTKIFESFIELVTLGMIDRRMVGGGFGAVGANSYYLTRFGIRFLKYINEALL